MYNMDGFIDFYDKANSTKFSQDILQEVLDVQNQIDTSNVNIYYNKEINIELENIEKKIARQSNAINKLEEKYKGKKNIPENVLTQWQNSEYRRNELIHKKRNLLNQYLPLNIHL